MASRRRNIKTHPKPNGDDGAPDTFTPPDRPDQLSGVDDGRLEVVDVFAKDSTVDLGGEEGGVDQDSRIEGDSRSMASEGDGDGDDARAEGADEGEGNARQLRGARASNGRGTGDDEGGTYSEKVRKRIARERALVNKERVLREQTQRELTEERAARQAQEERIARLERVQTDIAGNAGVKDIEAKLEALKPQLAAAMEAGETAKALDLQDKIADLRADLKVLKYDLAQKQRQADAARTTATSATRAGTTTEAVDDPRVKELVDQFFRSNRHWWNRSANKDARDDTITIDKEILADISAGELAFEPYSDEHFEELARRLHDSHPDLEIQDLAGTPYSFEDDEDDDMSDTGGNRNGRQNNGRQAAGPRQNGRAPVGRMGQNGRRAATEVDLARQGKVTLNQDDFNTMRLFKMDPNNANDKKYFAKEKMRSILSGQRGGERS